MNSGYLKILKKETKMDDLEKLLNKNQKTKNLKNN